MKALGISMPPVLSARQGALRAIGSITSHRTTHLYPRPLSYAYEPAHMVIAPSAVLVLLPTPEHADV